MEEILEQLFGSKNRYLVTCRDKDGNVKWEEEFTNLVTDEGRTDNLQQYFKGSSYTAAWYVGFKSAIGGQATGDTLAAHAGWTEVLPQGANRQALVFNDAAAKSITTGQFDVPVTLAGPTDVGGAFICNAQTGTAGKLWSVGDFSQLKSVSAGDTLQVTVTFNA